MAQQLRIQHNLVTLRCGWHPGSAGAQVSVRLMDGREHVDELIVPATEFGFEEDLSPRVYRGASLRLPDILDKLLHEAMARIGPDVPLWIHIARDAGTLAILPWELLLRQRPILDGISILRIPNFLTDPFSLSERTTVAVCISSPNAKMPFPAAEYARRLVEAFSFLATRPVSLHLFADLDSHYDLSGLTGSGHCNVVVHDPSGYAFDERVTIDRELEARDHRLQNPWMLWMAETLRGNPVDAVHFICPGYFKGDRGSLALAETPAKNYDSHWSRFVGSEEIHALLDALGAHTVGFSAPFVDVWAMGLRLLAFNLSWRRPGPIIVHDGGTETFDDVPRNYAFLFRWLPDYEPVPALRTEFYCHPTLAVSGDRQDLPFEDRLSVSGDMLALAQEPAEHQQDMLVDPPGSFERVKVQGETSWAELATRHFDLHEASLSAIEQDTAASPSEKEGSLEAIRFMRHALEASTAPGDSAAMPSVAIDDAESEA
ncbi:MAG: hypothetical protein NXI27_19830 [Alphaproteobacteria bacterium]|nr:hypothetical protein [Alphaproteobacteria bacterium]